MERFDPQFDLKLEKVVDVSIFEFWKAWTTPELICQWFCPAPWKVIECDIDLKPGGIFRTVMKSPEGSTFPNVGCYLEIVENKKLAWTNALLPGFKPALHPQSAAGFVFSCIIELEDLNGKTKYTAIVKHAGQDERKKHEDMGFQQGWSICADQLEALVKNKR